MYVSLDNIIAIIKPLAHQLILVLLAHVTLDLLETVSAALLLIVSTDLNSFAVVLHIKGTLGERKA